MVYSDARQYSQAGEYALTLSGGPDIWNCSNNAISQVIWLAAATWIVKLS